MKKILSLLLVSIMALIMISSCASDAPQLLKFIDENEVYTADFKGDTITFGLRSFDFGDTIIPDDDINTSESDEQRARIKNVQTKLNCVIEQQLQEESGLIAAAIAGNSTKTDIYYGASYEHFQWHLAGLLHNFKDIDAIDLSDYGRWGSQDRQNIMTYKGFVFGIYPKPLVVPEDATGIILVNDNKIQGFGQPTPKELLEDGNWTFDYFKNYVVSVSDLNSDEPTYGMTIVWTQEFLFPLTAIFANGSSILKADDNGNYKFNVATDSKAIKALEWSAEAYATGAIVEDNYGSTFAGMFANGQSSMWLGSSGVGFTANFDQAPLDLMTDGFSFMPFPYGPDAEYGKTPSTYYVATMSYAIPISSDANDMGLFLNEFLKATKTDAELEIDKENYKNQFFHNPEDYDFVYNAGVNAVYTYFNTELFNVQADLCEALDNILKGKKSTSETLGAITPKIQGELKNFEE